MATGSKRGACVGAAAGVEQGADVVVARGVVGRIGRERGLQPVERGGGVAFGHQLLGGLHLVFGRRLGGARHVLVEELPHLGLGQRADEAVDRLAALEQDAERNAAHAEHLRQLLRDLGLLVGVELDELEAAGVGDLELLEDRPERLARAAPRRPDVEQHRLLRARR